MQTPRYYVHALGGRDLYPGGFADLECALELAAMYRRDHPRGGTMVLDQRGRCYARLGTPRVRIKETVS